MGRSPAAPVVLVWACAGASLSDSRDAYDECDAWAQKGECNVNPGFMLVNCANACTKAPDLRDQMRRECEGYANQGECSRNPSFMLSTCRAECDAWEARIGLKIDRHARCVEWSLFGKCEREPAEMAVQCNTSCTVRRRCLQSNFSGWSIGVCDKALRCEAQDKLMWCKSLAASGKCREDTSKMAQGCLQTCGEQDVDAVLSAHRPENRAILSPLMDLPSREARLQERCWLHGWAGHNSHKLMLPTICAASRTLPWQRAHVPHRRVTGSSEDAFTCPFDVSRSTPRVRRRMTEVTTPSGQVVRVQHVLASPRVRLLHNFITPEEAAEIMSQAQSAFHRSPVRSVATERRTSSTATLFSKNWAVDSIRARISHFSGYEDGMLEPLQVVRYHPGEKYEPHHDLFDICDFPQKPRRHLTFLIYLNDLPDDAGGHTTFPRLHLRIQPKAYTALVFNDVLDSGMDDERTEHSGTAPSRGVKYAINCWIRATSEPRGLLGLGTSFGL